MTTDTRTNTDTENGGGNGGRLSGATQRASDALGSARTRASDAYSAARDRTSAAYSSARETASRAGQRTAQGVETYPEAAILGGLALGAVVAALLPKTERETQALGNFGRRINDTARQAAQAAKEAGRSSLEEAGLNRDAAKQKLADIAERARDVAKTSATAAAQTVRSPQ